MSYDTAVGDGRIIKWGPGHRAALRTMPGASRWKLSGACDPWGSFDTCPGPAKIAHRTFGEAGRFTHYQLRVDLIAPFGLRAFFHVRPQSRHGCLRQLKTGHLDGGEGRNCD